ncbi:hypothetical protein COCOR_04008 [Corallococcus coralloides DSM 2259]|uniref:Helix-turn-helix domain-containing protein n=1 Tax=Corallococcus coralloides (strain ATCC 25202 / DSM 2259 / NBRC 100086 / M2) TaxID=1144275 RepID=H8MVM8_CORCM|nr:hypothetical protein COCOR_04008 [Corallococcus coralloides DSM 2259]
MSCDGSSSGEGARLAAVPDEGFWSAEKVAAYLGVSTAWVWKQVRANTGFPFVKLGTRNYRFSPAKVRAWVEQQPSEKRP